MIECENGHHLYQKEEEEKDDSIKKSNISLKLDLNVIEESDENLKNKEEEHLSEEESLGFNSNYNLYQNNVSGKENINSKDKISKRKASTLSTSLSQTENSETNSFLTPKNLRKNFERKASYSQNSPAFFGRERLNSTPLTTYYDGLDLYIRGLHPDKNEYKKSNNYIEKEIYFKQNNFAFRNCKFKSFDLTEQKTIFSNQILNNEGYYKNKENNKLTTSLIVENNIQNNINNSQNILSKYDNYIYGKFDMPMPYYGYYNIDGKYFYKLFIYFSIQKLVFDAK